MQPGGSQNPAAPQSMSLNQHALPEALGGGGRQPRADQVPSESNLMNPNDPVNRDNAAVDHMINGIWRRLPLTYAARRTKMLVRLPIIILTSLHPMPIADAVPKLDIARECQFESGSKEQQGKCATDETQAREQLQTEWSQFTPSAKTQCSQATSSNGVSSYVELQICLEMERDVKKQQGR